MKNLSIILLSTVMCPIAQAQSRVSFEVASIKPLPPPAPGWGIPGTVMSGGPGSKNPVRWTAENTSLSSLLIAAYELKANELAAPSWLEEQRFEILARVPERATPEQFRIMLQSLLVERFHLETHREAREAQVYELVVAKNGPKFREAVVPRDPEAAPAPPSTDSPKIDRSGFPELPPGRNSMMLVVNGRARARQLDGGLDQFAAMLSDRIGHHVTNATGLNGKYDLTLTWSTGDPSNAESGPDIFTALQEQLGLKLEKKKGTSEVLVVDHIDKLPTEN